MTLAVKVALYLNTTNQPKDLLCINFHCFLYISCEINCHKQKNRNLYLCRKTGMNKFTSLFIQVYRPPAHNTKPCSGKRELIEPPCARRTQINPFPNKP